MRLLSWLGAKFYSRQVHLVDGLIPSVSANVFCPKLAAILAANPHSVPFREAKDYFLKLNKEEQRLVLSKIQYAVNDGSFNPPSTVALWCVIEKLSDELLHSDYPDLFGPAVKPEFDLGLPTDTQDTISIYELARRHTDEEIKARAELHRAS